LTAPAPAAPQALPPQLRAAGLEASGCCPHERPAADGDGSESEGGGGEEEEQRPMEVASASSRP
jgi:hypothetical protein